MANCSQRFARGLQGVPGTNITPMLTLSLQRLLISIFGCDGRAAATTLHMHGRDVPMHCSHDDARLTVHRHYGYMQRG